VQSLSSAQWVKFGGTDYWVWYTNPASYKSPARQKPFSNGRCCFTQV